MESVYDDVIAMWKAVWGAYGFICKYQPTAQQVYLWLEHDATNMDLVLESVEDGIPNFIRRINGKPGDTIRSGTATWCVNYISGVVRNKKTNLSQSDVIREAD